jgi:hypothetical protein
MVYWDQLKMAEINKYLYSTTKRWDSYVTRFRKAGMLNEQIETAINNLTLEDLIVIKLELSTRTQKSPLFGIPIWDTLNVIVRDALLKYAISVTQTPSEAAASVGLSLKQFRKNMKEFRMYNYIPSRKK